jgi:hypothetical protein
MSKLFLSLYNSQQTVIDQEKPMNYFLLSSEAPLLDFIGYRTGFLTGCFTRTTFDRIHRPAALR